MSDADPKKPSPVERILAEARRAREGEPSTPVALIEAHDRDLVRALRRAAGEERTALLRLLGRLGARGRRAAEQALGAGGLDDEGVTALLAFLAERQPDHLLPAAYHGLSAAVAADDLAAARGHLGRLPPPVLATWARRAGVPMLAPLAPGLARLLREEPGAATALTEALGRDVPAAALGALAGVAQGSASKGLHKAVRAAFFRLEQQGVVVPALPSPEASGRRADPAAEARAFLSAVDPTGDQAVWVLEELPEGGYSVLQAILGEEGGIEAASGMILVRRGYESLLRTLEKESSVPLVEVPVELAIGLVEAAYAHNPAVAGREYLSWRQARGAGRRARRPELPAVPAEERAGLVERSAELLDDPSCATWLLTRAEAEQAETGLSAGASALVLPEPETRRRKQEALERTAAELFPAARRRRLAHRLEATTFLLQARGDDRLAAIARATAEAVRGEAPVPFLTGLVERSIEALARVREREKEAKPIVEP